MIDDEDRFIAHRIDSNWGTSIHVMYKDGSAYGRIYWYNDDHDTAYFEGIHVGIDRRGEHIGTQLLMRLETLAERNHLSVCKLQVELDYRATKLLAWYNKHGYKIITGQDAKEGDKI